MVYKELVEGVIVALAGVFVAKWRGKSERQV